LGGEVDGRIIIAGVIFAFGLLGIASMIKDFIEQKKDVLIQEKGESEIE
jgi:hypothetical protein